MCARARAVFVCFCHGGRGITEKTKAFYGARDCTVLHCTEERTKKIEALRRFSYLEGWRLLIHWNEGRNRQGLATGTGEGMERDQPLEWVREQRNFSH